MKSVKYKIEILCKAPIIKCVLYFYAFNLALLTNVLAADLRWFNYTI